jgi:hypothetical protein
MRLRLCDPLVCNRYLLWGLYGTASTIVSLGIPLQYAAYERESVFNATWDTLINAGEILTIALIWLVFFPPALYRRWIAGGEALTGAVEGS